MLPGSACWTAAAGAIDTGPLLGQPFSLAGFREALASGRAGQGIKVQVASNG